VGLLAIASGSSDCVQANVSFAARLELPKSSHTWYASCSRYEAGSRKRTIGGRPVTGRGLYGNRFAAGFGRRDSACRLAGASNYASARRFLAVPFHRSSSGVADRIGTGGTTAGAIRRRRGRVLHPPDRYRPGCPSSRDVQARAGEGRWHGPDRGGRGFGGVFRRHRLFASVDKLDSHPRPLSTDVT